MKKNKYIAKIEYESEPIIADDEDEAVNKFFIEIDERPQETLATFISDHTTAKRYKKEPDIYNAEHPDRQKAIRIIESIPQLAKLEGEKYYEVEDKITRIINGKE